MPRDGKTQPHPGPPLARSHISGIVEFDPAAVVFQNAADDRKSQARALLTGRYVGLKQPGSAHLGQANSVIDYVDHDVVVLARGDNLDTALRLVPPPVRLR